MANLKNAQYVALTTHGPNGWYVVLLGEPGQSKAKVEELATRQICGNQWDKPKDIFADTEMKNLQAVSASAARRAFPKAMRSYDAYLEHQALSGA